MGRIIEKFSRKHAVIFACVVSALYGLFLVGVDSVISFTPLGKLPVDAGIFNVISLAVEIFFSIAAVVFLRCTGFLPVLTNKGVGFFKGLFAGGYLLVASVISIPALLLSYSGERTPNSPFMIGVFFLLMVFVGVAEELTFRGVVTTTLYNRFAKSKGGVWKTVALSGLLFGLMHLTNIASGLKPAAVAVQTVMAVVLGMVFVALYLRNGTIWPNVALHAFYDVAAGITSIYKSGSIQQTIDGYHPALLLSGIPYLLVLFFLLRKTKICTIPANFEHILDAAQESSPAADDNEGDVAPLEV